MSSRRVFDTATLTRRSPSLVAIGNFDGVHRGHRAVLSDAAHYAVSRGLVPLVLTFDPHPSEVLGRGTQPALTTLQRKLALLLRVHPELTAVVEPFTIELSQFTPAEFVRRILIERLDAKVVVVGENFRFGRDRAGDLQTLRELASELGFEARVEPLVGDEEGSFSSTRVREKLRVGDLAAAEQCLGRPHSISGRVSRGDGRGRTIGVPTANLVEVAEALPPQGVYACLVDRANSLGGGSALGIGAMNLGVRPTVGGGFSVEAHLLDFEGDLYDQYLRIHLVARLRDERRFSGLDALKQQIATDLQDARRVLASRVPDADADGAWA